MSIAIFKKFFGQACVTQYEITYIQKSIQSIELQWNLFEKELSNNHFKQQNLNPDQTDC